MNEYTRIYLPLSKDEFIALQEQAVREIRHPRDQARHILRMVLLGNNSPAHTKANSDGIRQDTSVAVAA